MRVITVSSHFSQPVEVRDAVCDWLRHHGCDPNEVDMIVEVRPGLFNVKGPCYDAAGKLVVRLGEIERWTKAFESEWPPPGLVDTL